MLKLVASLALLLIAVASARGQCPGCPSVAKCPSVQVEEEHCHWLEVTGLVPGGVAEKAGVKPGDVLYSYGGRTVGCMADLGRAKEAATAESVDVVFRRAGGGVRLRLARAQQLGVYLNEWQKDVVPDKDARIIRGVAELSWATGKENSFMAALEAVLRQQGVDVSYAMLCGASGAAFRLHFFDTWCPSSADPSCGFDATRPALAACGYSADALRIATDGKNRGQMLARVRKSIDAGVPVLAFGLNENPEWGVITGYQKQGEEMFVRTYFDTRKNYDLAQGLPRLVVIPRRTGRAPATVASMRRSFAIAAENLATEKYGEYYSGLAAFDRWQTRLLGDDFTGLDSAGFSNVVQANYWMFSRLVSDRRTGLEYLVRVKQQLPKHAGLIDQLVELYTAELELLAPFEDKLPRPGSATKPEDWSQAMRAEQAAILAQAQELELKVLPLWQELAAAK
uniref:PDZ domain-containing protein n=1 Tax=candidate division WOR-3 bacterium TaxID=2052148 RepID=A0A7C4CDC1_UNCW3